MSTDSDLIQTYQQVLGQPPDAATLAADEALLASGVSLQAIRSYIALSPTAAAALNSTYHQVLGVTPPAADIGLDQSLLASGQSLAGIRTYLAGYAESMIGVIYNQVLDGGHRQDDARRRYGVACAGTEFGGHPDLPGRHGPRRSPR